MKGATYDPKCYELAVYFLEDHYDEVPKEIAMKLAKEIQESIEDFIYHEVSMNVRKAGT